MEIKYSVKINHAQKVIRCFFTHRHQKTDSLIKYLAKLHLTIVIFACDKASNIKKELGTVKKDVIMTFAGNANHPIKVIVS